MAVVATALFLAGTSVMLGQMRPGSMAGQSGNMNQQQPGMQQNNMQPGQMTPQNSAEANFVANMRRNSKVEADLSKMALKNSSNDQVKQFAQQVISENRRNDMALTSAANSNGSLAEMSFSAPVPSQTHQAEKQMKKTTGTDFDKLYIGQMDGYIKNDQQLTTNASSGTATGNMGSVAMQLRNTADNRVKQLAQVAQSENLKLR